LTRTPNSWQKIAKAVGGVKLAEEVKDIVDDLAFRNCCGVTGGFCEGVYRASGLLILSGVLADVAGKDEWWLLSVGRSIDVDVLHCWTMGLVAWYWVY
jgi:hypothetical protein